MMFRKPLLVMLFLLIALTVIPLYAQDDDTSDTTSTTADSTVSIYVVVCADRAVVNLSGTLLSGDDLYYQMFAGSQGTGEALSSLRRASVDGAYSFSEVITFPENKVIEIGGYGSLYVSLSADGQPETSRYNEYVDDIQDGCAEPQNVVGSSTEADGSVVDGGTTGTSGPAIASPFGGSINPGYAPYDPAVKEAAGPAWVPPRQSTAGLIFAECNQYPMAEPGLLYDTDEITVFWSWFAATEEDMQAHLDTAQYDVKYHDNPIINVERTPIEQRGSNYWVFWYARLGNRPPGYHHISYRVTWTRAISDGYDNFGPGTSTPEVFGSCGFVIRANPEGTAVNYSTWPFDDQNPWPIPNWPEAATIVPRPTESTE